MGTTSKEHPVEGPPTNAPKARDRVYRDPFFVSEKRREEYGIKPDEDVRWARDAERWARFEFSDRQEELMADPSDGGMAGQLVTTSEYDKVRIGGSAGDLVLMKFPRSILEDDQANVDAGRTDFERNMVKTDDGYESEEDVFVRKSRSQMLAEHEYHQKTGLVGGPTAGLSLAAAEALMERKYGREAIEAKQERLRMGGQHSPADDQRSIVQMMGAARDMQSANRPRGKTVAMGDSGFGRNANSPLAQAARREGRA